MAPVATNYLKLANHLKKIIATIDSFYVKQVDYLTI